VQPRRVRDLGGVLLQTLVVSGPLGLTLAPSGDLIAVNGTDGKAIEITPLAVRWRA
jgi:hypothetical protein